MGLTACWFDSSLVRQPISPIGRRRCIWIRSDGVESGRLRCCGVVLGWVESGRVSSIVVLLGKVLYGVVW